MATTRFKGETAGERLDYSSISDSDMLQLRHKPGTIEDEDKGISKSQLLSCPFGVSSTAAGTAAKTASLTDSNPDFILVSGREVVVCFTTANTASNPTLNFAGSGAIPIYYPNGSVVGAWDVDTWMHLKYFYATVGNTSIQRWILMSPLSVDIVASNSKELITSGGVASAIDIPKDAVLHYSFDEVPDYPDGTADVRLIDNNTYDIQSTNYQFRINNNDAIINNDNGLVKIIMNSRGSYGGVFITSTYAYQKVIKLRIKVTNLSVGKLHIFYGSTNVIDITESGIYEVITYVETNNGLYFDGGGNANSCTFTVEEIYIGDGSYTTPIIDNANGQNNATNNGGIATKGVSGKGVKCFPNKQVNISNFNFAKDFTVSLWVNPENTTASQQGIIILKGTSFNLRNGTSNTNKPTLIVCPDGVSTSFTILDDLLPVKWSHLVIVKNGTKLTTFLDSVKKTEFILTSANLMQTDSEMSLNVTSNTRTQSYDDLLIFDRALTDTEVMALYLNKANTPKYYSWADWKLEQMTNATRSVIEQPSEEENREDER